MHYFLRGEFQNHLTKYYNEHGKELNFLTLFENLKKNNLLLDAYPTIPSHDFFDEISDEDYFEYLNNAPLVFIDNFGNHSPNIITEDDMIPKEKDVFVIQHFLHIKDNNHHHDYFEINYVFKGSCTFNFEQETRTLEEGALCILSPFSNHEIKVTDDSSVVTICIRKSTFYTTFFSLLSQNDLLSLFFRTILHDSSKPNYLLFLTENFDSIKKVIKNLSLENNKFDTYSNNSCISWINLLFTIILRNYNKTIQFYNYDVGTDFSLVLKYIQHNHQTLSLSELAKLFHYTVPYLSKLIKKNTGFNFCDLIKQLRMSEAINYLTNTDLKVSEIAEICGYNSMDHFSRVFRNEYKVSPQKFRKNKNVL